MNHTEHTKDQPKMQLFADEFEQPQNIPVNPMPQGESFRVVRSYITIRKSITGGWLVSCPCPVTGKRQDEHISAVCSIEHISQVAKHMSKHFNSGAHEIAITAEARMNRALALRAKRAKDESYKQEVFDTLDMGFLPSPSQLRRAGMLH
jgi:hypothetical protein